MYMYRNGIGRPMANHINRHESAVVGALIISIPASAQPAYSRRTTASVLQPAYNQCTSRKYSQRTAHHSYKEIQPIPYLLQ
eukprot:1196343-Prorocentrum_minimum.AAC.4